MNVLSVSFTKSGPQYVVDKMPDLSTDTLIGLLKCGTSSDQNAVEG